MPRTVRVHSAMTTSISSEHRSWNVLIPALSKNQMELLAQQEIIISWLCMNRVF